MVREQEPFIALLIRTVRNRWKFIAKVLVACFVSITTIVMLLPPSFMAVGLVRIGYVGPGFGGLSLNTIATEAGSTGFIERVKKEVGAEDAKMVARVRFKSDLIELRAYARTPELAQEMVRTAGNWMVEEHSKIIDEVFAGGKALYLERFGKRPETEELYFNEPVSLLKPWKKSKASSPVYYRPCSYPCFSASFWVSCSLSTVNSWTRRNQYDASDDIFELGCCHLGRCIRSHSRYGISQSGQYR